MAGDEVAGLGAGDEEAGAGTGALEAGTGVGEEVAGEQDMTNNEAIITSIKLR